ncbi:hypothetical protein TWF506_004345 [Arthrobotrys conoides]|uniref:Uncharacterized protein n=1 Tax=Arthrobotrys conoides TaxID=74498 RepID=A0AAN8NJW1_9PEZI
MRVELYCYADTYTAPRNQRKEQLRKNKQELLVLIRSCLPEAHGSRSPAASGPKTLNGNLRGRGTPARGIWKGLKANNQDRATLPAMWWAPGLVQYRSKVRVRRSHTSCQVYGHEYQ